MSIVSTINGPCLCLGSTQSRQKQCCQNCDDCNNHQKFDQRERIAKCFHEECTRGASRRSGSGGLHLQNYVPLSNSVKPGLRAFGLGWLKPKQDGCRTGPGRLTGRV